MSKTYYSEINLHVTWHTKDNSRLITPAIEADLYAFLKDKIVTTDGAYFHGIGGIEDHLHIGMSVAPKIHLDEWFGQLKGSSSHEFGSALKLAKRLRRRQLWNQRPEMGSQLYRESERTT